MTSYLPSEFVIVQQRIATGPFTTQTLGSGAPDTESVTVPATRASPGSANAGLAGATAMLATTASARAAAMSARNFMKRTPSKAERRALWRALGRTTCQSPTIRGVKDSGPRGDASDTETRRSLAREA